MITFNDVLQSAGLDPAVVRLIRHQDSRADRSIYAVWKSPGGPELVEAYQAVQSRDVFQIGGFVASFVVTPPPSSETLFIGLYKVLGREKCAPGEQDPLLGIGVGGYHRYEMARDSRLDEYKERLSVDWGRGVLAFVQLAARHPKSVLALRDLGEPRFPGFSQFCVNVQEVPGLYPSWQERLSETKEIYVLVDKATGKQYVGSAKGEDGLFSRLCNYARTGDGGDVALRHRPGAQYQVGILEVVNQSLPDYRIEEIENWWKRKLMTREFGLNCN